MQRRIAMGINIIEEFSLCSCDKTLVYRVARNYYSEMHHLCIATLIINLGNHSLSIMTRRCS